MPDLKSKDVAAAALKIQSVYRGFQTRKVAKTALTSTTQKLKEVLQPVPSKGGAVPKKEVPKKEICPMCKQTVPGSLPGRAKSHCEGEGFRFLFLFAQKLQNQIWILTKVPTHRASFNNFCPSFYDPIMTSLAFIFISCLLTLLVIATKYLK